MNYTTIAQNLNQDKDIFLEDLLDKLPEAANWDYSNLNDSQIAKIASTFGVSFAKATGQATDKPQKKGGDIKTTQPTAIAQAPIRDKVEAVKYINGQRLVLKIDQTKQQTAASDQRAQAHGYVDAQREYHQYRTTRDTVFNQLVNADDEFETALLQKKAQSLDTLLINDANSLMTDIMGKQTVNKNRSEVLGDLLTGLQDLTSQYSQALDSFDI